MTTINKRTKIPTFIFEVCNYFFPRIMFLQSAYTPQVHWGDIAIALQDFPEDCHDISSKEFWDIWMEKWKYLGDQYYTKANSMKIEYCKQRLFRSAAACYHWAEFMYFSNKTIKTELRNNVKLCFKKSLNQNCKNIKHGEIMFGSIVIPYYLVLPNIVSSVKRLPCIILSNGLDSVTEIEVLSFAEQFSSSGIVALLFDGPGQGINLGVNPLQIEFEYVVKELIKFLHNVKIVDINNLAFFGVSFGGYFALRVAKYLGKHFRCIVNLSGGPNLSEFNLLPRRLKEDFKYAFMEEDNEEMQKIFNKLKIEIPECHTQILSIHGELDDIFPISRLKRLDFDLKEKHKLISYSNESHVCLNYINQYCCEMLSWVISKFSL